MHSQSMIKKIGITGGTGLIGKILIKVLSRKKINFSLYRKDIRKPQDIKRWLKNNKDINIIFHLAAIVPIDKVDNNKKKFDVFFLDPPFADDKFIQILNLIKKKELYNNKHVIIVHRERESCDVLDKTINTLIVKEYGRSKIIFGVFK